MSRAAGSGTTTTVRINLTARGVTLNGRAVTGPTEDAFAAALSLVSAQAANLPKGGFLPVSVTDERADGYESTRTNVLAGNTLTPSLFTRRSGNVPALPPSIMPRSRPAHAVSPASIPPSIAPTASPQRRVPNPGHPPKEPSAPPAEDVPIFRSDKAPSATEKVPHKETDPTLSAEDLFGTTTADRRTRRRHRSRAKGHRTPHASSLGDLFTFSPPSSPAPDAVEAAEGHDGGEDEGERHQDDEEAHRLQADKHPYGRERHVAGGSGGEQGGKAEAQEDCQQYQVGSEEDGKGFADEVAVEDGHGRGEFVLCYRALSAPVSV